MVAYVRLNVKLKVQLFNILFYCNYYFNFCNKTCIMEKRDKMSIGQADVGKFSVSIENSKFSC